MHYLHPPKIHSENTTEPAKVDRKNFGNSYWQPVNTLLYNPFSRASVICLYNDMGGKI